MGSGNLRKDNNFITAQGAVSSATDSQVKGIQYDPNTRGITVHIVGNDVNTTTVDTYNVNDIDEGATVTYVGLESDVGAWYLKKIDETTNPTTVQHATVINNSSVASYSDAWTNRATLTYEDYNSAF